MLTQEQKVEKAVQHVITFAKFASSEYGGNQLDVLCMAAARVFEAQQGTLAIEDLGTKMGDHIRALVLGNENQG